MKRSLRRRAGSQEILTLTVRAAGLGAVQVAPETPEMVSLIVGLIMVVFHRPLGKHTIRFQRRLGFSFSEKVIRRTQIICLIVGLWFVATGVLEMLNVIGHTP